MPQLFGTNYEEVRKQLRILSRKKKGMLVDGDTYIQRMKNILQPFMLRRLKSEVSKNNLFFFIRY